jgi:hypothetical protein
MAPAAGDVDVDLANVSPRAWRLLRVAAGYEQRAVEKEVDDLVQAHISMLENDTRSLSPSQLELLFALYARELTESQIEAIVEQF